MKQEHIVHASPFVCNSTSASRSVQEICLSLSLTVQFPMKRVCDLAVFKCLCVMSPRSSSRYGLKSRYCRGPSRPVRFSLLVLAIEPGFVMLGFLTQSLLALFVGPRGLSGVNKCLKKSSACLLVFAVLFPEPTAWLSFI